MIRLVSGRVNGTQQVHVWLAAAAVQPLKIYASSPVGYELRA